MKITSLVVCLAGLISPPLLADTKNLASGAAITASTELRPATDAIDGRLQTRWESEHGIDDTTLQLDLGSSKPVAELEIYWEAANAEHYQVLGSNDGQQWLKLSEFSNGQYGERTDKLSLSGNYRYIQLHFDKRSAGNQWGYSIWEINLLSQSEQLDDSDAISIQSATASTELQPAVFAIDTSMTSRWESQQGIDDAWLQLDLGQVTPLGEMDIDWEAANAKEYEVLGSVDGVQWQSLTRFSDGTYGDRVDRLALSGSYRYVKMVATKRSDDNHWGYSIYNVALWKSWTSDEPPTTTEPGTEPGTLPGEGDTGTEPGDQPGDGDTGTTPGDDTPTTGDEPDDGSQTPGDGGSAPGDGEQTPGGEIADNGLIHIVNAQASTAMQPATNAIDDDHSSRWESAHQQPDQWLLLDLGKAYSVAQIAVDWEAANAKHYQVLGSVDGNQWDTLNQYSNGTYGNRTDTLGITGQYRYLKLVADALSDGNNWGYSVYDVRVYASSDDLTPIDPEQAPVALDTSVEYTPLYSQNNPEESANNWYVEPDGTIVTVGSGRARSRHESEDIFYTFPVHYFEYRTFKFEVHDHVAAGGDYIAIYYEPEYAHYTPPGCRSSYHNKYRADFNDNAGFEPMKVVEAGPDGKGEKWVCYIRRDAHDNDDGKLEKGEWMEVEFQEFLGKFEGDPTIQGQAVYYTDTYRFKMGTPGLSITEDPQVEAKIRSGGRATAPFVRAGDDVPANQILSTDGTNVTYKVGSNGKWVPADDPNGKVVTYKILDGIDVYDNYVVDSGVADWTTFFREALNIQWDTHNDFLNGRRVFHTRFTDGNHLEDGNPVFEDMVGLSTDLADETACAACHIHNGRGKALNNGDSLSTAIVKVSSGMTDSRGHPLPHSYFGGLLQNTSMNSAILPEASTYVTYVEQKGTYPDGSAYSLRVPTYHVNVLDRRGGSVPHISPRSAQNITGLGLLEAIPESEILEYNDPDDANKDGISGRVNIVVDPETGEEKIGRFGWKADHESLRQFAAQALHEDMGVNTSIYPEADCGALQVDCKDNAHQGAEMKDKYLDQLTVYLQMLGSPARRPDEIANPDVDAGEALFKQVGCAACHRQTFTTGYSHPKAELRGNEIHPYTDLLLHDMGDALADTLTNNAELNREWRTAPLWGIGMDQAVNGHTQLMHDGRARDIEEAILWHGGEAKASADAFKQLSAQERQQLLSFVHSL